MVVTSLGTVLLPRMSNMISNNQMSEFKELAQKSLDFIVLVTLPITMGLILLSDYLIIIFCGNDYLPAISTLRILAPIIIFIGVSNVFGIQILYPQGHERIVIFATAAGALINFIINLWLIPKYSQDGAAIATFIAELLVTVVMCVIGRRLLWVSWKKDYWVYLFGTFAMGLIVYLIKQIEINFTVDFIISIIAGLIVYFLVLLLVKDPFYMMGKNIVMNKLKLKK